MFLKSSRYYALKSTFDLMTMYAYSFFLNQCFKNQGHQENYYVNPIISSSSNNLIENINIFLFLFF